MQQLPLEIQLSEFATFENFRPGHNQQLFALLRDLPSQSGSHFVFVWGSRGAGKTHLLQALCHAADAQQGTVAYIPLDEPFVQPEMLSGLEQMALVVLDNLDAVAHNREWSEAIFHLYNRLRDAGHSLVISAGTSAADVETPLADLQSRLCAMLVFRLQTLSDEEKVALLIQKAKASGLELSGEVAQFIVNRSPRGVGELLSLLQKLDKASLQEQRRLTIPFVKQVLAI